VVAPWIQNPVDREGNDVNFYRRLLGIKPIDLGTLEEMPDPVDKETGEVDKEEMDRQTKQRAEAKRAISKNTDAHKEAIRSHRRLFGALQDQKRLSKGPLQRANPYSLASTPEQVGFLLQLGYEAVDQEMVEAIASQNYPQYDRYRGGAQKIVCSEVLAIGLPEDHADFLVFCPEPIVGGGSPMKGADYCEDTLGIPVLNIRECGTAEEWESFFAAVTKIIGKKVIKAEAKDLTATIFARLEAIDKDAPAADGSVITTKGGEGALKEGLA
jgi:hypothetical protein